MICNHFKNIPERGCFSKKLFNEPDKKAILPNTIKETRIKSPPNTKNCNVSFRVSENKNPGNKAKKNKETLGFKTFIIKPWRYNLDKGLAATFSAEKLIVSEDLYT